MKGIQVCSNKGPRSFPRGDNYEIAKIQWRILQIFFSRTTGPISTKLGTNHPLVSGIPEFPFVQMKGPALLPRGDNYEIVKIQWRMWKILLSRTSGPISTKLGTKYLWVKGIQVYSNKGSRLFPRGDNYDIAKILWRNFKIFFSRTNGTISTKLGTKHFWVKKIQICSNEGPWPFPRGDSYEIRKIHWRILKKFFSRRTNYPWVKGIQVCSNEGTPLFLRRDNFKIVEIHWRNFKIFFSRTTGPISTKFSTKHPLVKGIQICSNEEPFNSHKVNNAWVFPSHNQHYDNHMCLLIWTVFSGERCGPWISCFCYVPNVSVSRARFAAILKKLYLFSFDLTLQNTTEV